MAGARRGVEQDSARPLRVCVWSPGEEEAHEETVFAAKRSAMSDNTEFGVFS